MLSRHILLSSVVIEPIFAGFKARDDRVTGFSIVFGGVLIGRTVATSNVSALSATTEVKPPAVARLAFNAAVSAWLS